jgi:PAS domain S-box-containing protein
MPRMTQGPWRYAIALLIAAAAIGGRWILDPLLGASVPFITLFLAVAAASWVGGLGPGLVTLVAGAAASSSQFLTSTESLRVGAAGEAVALGMYLLTGATIAAIAASQRRARRLAVEATRKAHDALHAVRLQREQLQITLSSIGDAVIVTDRDGNVTLLNPVAQRLTGWSADEACGRPLPEVFPIINELTRQPAENPVSRVLATGAVVGLANHTALIARDGTERPIDDSAAPILDEGGTIRGVVLVFRDISARRRDEEQRARLAAIVETSDDAILSKSLDGTVRTWNPAAERLFGYSTEEMVGQPVQRLVPPERQEEHAGVMARLARGERIGHMETVRVRKDGRRVAVSVTISPLRDGAGRIWGASTIARDVTERQRAARRQAAQQVATSVLAGAGTLSEAAPTLLRTLCEALGWDLGALWARDEQANGLRCVAVWSDPASPRRAFEEASRSRTFEPGVGLPGRVWAAARPFWVEDVVRDDNFPRAPVAAAAGLHGAFGFPILLDGEVLGVIEFFSQHIEPPDEDLLRMFAAIGSQIGQFIERRRVEAAAMIGEERLRLALEAGRMGTWEWDIPTQRVAWSPGLELIHGLRPGTFPGTFEAFQADIHPEDRERVLASVQNALETGNDYRVEYRLALPGGVERWVEARGKLFQDEFGRPSRMMGICMDITDRQLAARALRESEERFRTLAEVLPQIVWVSRPDGSREYDNQRWYDYTGLTPDTSLGRGWTAALHPDDREPAERLWMEASRAGKPYEVEYRIRGADGAYRWFLGRALPLRGSDGRIVRWFGSCTDIDERKRYEASLKEAKELAETAGRAKDQFLAMLSHELRTPLTPVLLAVTAMLNETPDDSEERTFLEMIRNNIELEARLIDDLLDVMRMIRGKMIYQFEVTDAHALVDRSLEICRGEIQSKGLCLRTELEASERFIRADPARIQQVLWNLLKNAVKFTPAGGTITVRSRNEGDRLILEVSDTGRGIEPDTLGRIFNAFEQAEDEVTRHFGGLGLGLAISRSIVEAHEGTLTAASAGRGHGATFTVNLATIVPTSQSARPPIPWRRPEAGRDLRILLVEDDPMTSRIMARLLRQRGHTVTTANTLRDALAAAEDDHDLVISDLGLPDGSGLDLMRQVTARGTVPSIALTGFGMESDVRRCHEAGFTAHLTKPIDFSKLEAMIHQVISDSGNGHRDPAAS